MKRILITDDMHASIIPMLEEIGFTPDYRPDIKRPEILSIIANYEGLLIRSKTKIDAEFLAHCTNLKFIGRAGAGLDLIDIEEVTKRNIQVFAANEGNRDAVAEQTMGMILCLFNKINIADNQVRNKIWLREENRGVELSGKTLGIIGYGYMGKALAQRLLGFDVRVLAHDKYNPVPEDEFFATPATMEQIYEEADIVSLHVPLTEETRLMVNEDFINHFKTDFYLINTSRGEVASVKAILEGLDSGKIKGACLDVLENEKMDKLNTEQEELYTQLFQKQNVILTPHIAGWTHESYQKINQVLVEKIREL
jgi:D-3-phosphoglycerate dehydrogenase / 2-oxoglutarate reductase